MGRAEEATPPPASLNKRISNTEQMVDMAKTFLRRQNRMVASLLSVLGFLLFSGFLPAAALPAVAGQSGLVTVSFDHGTEAWSYGAKLSLATGTSLDSRAEFTALPTRPKLYRHLADEFGNGGSGFFQLGGHPATRRLPGAFWVATIALLLIYLVISFEWMHRTLVSLLGAALMLFITYTWGTYRPLLLHHLFRRCHAGH